MSENNSKSALKEAPNKGNLAVREAGNSSKAEGGKASGNFSVDEQEVSSGLAKTSLNDNPQLTKDITQTTPASNEGSVRSKGDLAKDDKSTNVGSRYSFRRNGPVDSEDGSESSSSDSSSSNSDNQPKRSGKVKLNENGKQFQYSYMGQRKEGDPGVAIVRTNKNLVVSRNSKKGTAERLWWDQTDAWAHRWIGLASDDSDKNDDGAWATVHLPKTHWKKRKALEMMKAKEKEENEKGIANKKRKV